MRSNATSAAGVGMGGEIGEGGRRGDAGAPRYWQELWIGLTRHARLAVPDAGHRISAALTFVPLLGSETSA